VKRQKQTNKRASEEKFISASFEWVHFRVA